MPFSHEFYRLSRLPPYVFAEVNALKAAARAQGEDIIDLGMGSPDTPPPDYVIEKLAETARLPDVHRYSPSKGIKGLRKALSAYYERRFNVSIDPEKEAVVTIGSKEGLASFATAVSNPGDIYMVPDPGYPIHMLGFIIEGASVYSVRNVPYEKVLADNIKLAIEQCRPKPVALVVNFPNNPTSETVSLEFYEEIVALCRHHKMFLISDIAYAEIFFDENNPPPSVLQVKGAKDIAIEFSSLSKTLSMAGWRVGFAAGNEKLVGALYKIKSYIDYGTFTAIQIAAAAALNGPESHIIERRNMYRSRRDTLTEVLHRAGWNVPLSKATMFTWAEIPEPMRHLGSVEFCKKMMREARVAASPGVGFGVHGEGHVRFAYVENEQRIRQAGRNIRKFLQDNGVSIGAQAQETAAAPAPVAPPALGGLQPDIIGVREHDGE